ncbi:Inner membrane protein YtfF [Andreprevotia sp. IGB-42]|uniref:DMT family transporter n=1 Tax=Andreprevotia sp. IGB-42 TaxID=2497473 RepID=UPI0013578E7A|nr:DMT family transporter [Andreprevotia sp. IGB-42]KAF0812868.1 Inner membrane protein YtfF [Andreprevotia sp. IGB-42]
MIKGITCGALAGAVWGGVFLVPQILADFSPLELMTGRYVAYGLVSLLLLLPVLKRVLPQLQRHDWITLLWLSVAGNLVYYLLLSVAVQRVGVAPTSLVIGMLPVLVTLVGVTGHNAIPIRQLALPLLAIVAGVACTSHDVFSAALPADLAQDAGSKAIGLLAAAGALVAWSAYAVGNARHLAKRPDLSSHDWSLLTGVITGALALIAALPLLLPGASAAAPARSWGVFTLMMIGLAIGPSVIGTGLWNAATRRLPLTLGGQMIIFETVFALLYGFLHEGRLPRPLEIAAIVLLLGGVAASSWVHATQAPPPGHAG